MNTPRLTPTSTAKAVKRDTKPAHFPPGRPSWMTGAPQGAAPPARAVITLPWLQPPVGPGGPLYGRRRRRPIQRAMNSWSPTVWLRTTSSTSLATPLGCGDDGAEVGLLDQLVDVDALDGGIHVHPVDHGFHIHPCEHAVQVDPVQQRVQIQRGNRKLDRPLRGGPAAAPPRAGRTGPPPSAVVQTGPCAWPVVVRSLMMEAGAGRLVEY